MTAAESDFTYTTVDNTAMVTGYTGSETELVIPDTLGGYTVTSIGNRALWQNQTFVSVTIPETVTSIEEYAFWKCTAFKENCKHY